MLEIDLCTLLCPFAFFTSQALVHFPVLIADLTSLVGTFFRFNRDQLFRLCLCLLSDALVFDSVPLLAPSARYLLLSEIFGVFLEAAVFCSIEFIQSSGGFAHPETTVLVPCSVGNVLAMFLRFYSDAFQTG